MSRTRLGLVGSMAAYLGFTPKSSAPIVTGPVRHARSGVCEAGATLSGLVPYRLRCTIGGVERGMLINSFSINHTAAQPSSCALQTTGFQVSNGQQVEISDDGVENLIFGGVIVNRRRQIQNNEQIIYDLQCADWWWLANSYARVFERFDGVAANVAVRRIVSTYCDPALGIRVGSIPSSLGTVSLTFAGETVMDAIGRIANAVQAVHELGPGKRLNLYRTEVPHGQTINLHDDTAVRTLIVEDFLSQVRNRVWFEGGGPQTTALAAKDATSIEVAECGWFKASGGFARADTMIIAYTGRSAASGPGVVTGVSGLTSDLPQGASIAVLVKADDPAKQATLAALLGEGLSGVSIYYQADGRMSLEEITGRAEQHLGFHGDQINQVSGIVDDRVPGARDWEAGRLVDVDVTDSEGEQAAGTFRIASVVIHGFAEQFTESVPSAPRSLRLEREVTLRPGVRQGVVDLLVGAA